MSEPNEQLPESDLPNIGQPARRALHLAGYLRLGQLVDVRESDLLKLHGVGPKALKILRQALADSGRSFAAEQSRERR